MTLDEVRRINDRRLAKRGQKYYYADRVYIGMEDGSLSLFMVNGSLVGGNNASNITNNITNITNVNGGFDQNFLLMGA